MFLSPRTRVRESRPPSLAPFLSAPVAFLILRFEPCVCSVAFDFPLSTVSAVSSILLLVFSRDKKLDKEAELYDVALRALARRPHSVHEMKKLLERRANRELLAQVVIARLKENGLLDDSRYAKQFARQRVEIRRQGEFRIARDLRARGIPDCHIEAAIGESTNDEVERDAVRQRIQRKLKLSRGPLDQKKIRAAEPVSSGSTRVIAALTPWTRNAKPRIVSERSERDHRRRSAFSC
jgi:SOS response regulatory protein OraA/RecX